ncbi:MAG: alkaline phosphatase family protein [Thermoanaerobaculia bacterium]
MRRALLLAVIVIFGCARPPEKKVLFIGLDGADWQLLDRYIADGTMPNLGKLVARGERRVLLTQHPPLSPLVWTSMMTGVSPLEHRILDFTRFNPITRVKEPITSDERAVPAIWNMAAQQKKRAAVFGLWATYPAEAIDGRIVSDRLFAFQYNEPDPPAGAVSPASYEPEARKVLRDVIAATPPQATEELRRIVIETETMHRLSADRIRHDHPDLVIVYFQGTDAIGHLFAPTYDRDAAIVRRYFSSIDNVLGEYDSLARETGADLVIASDHGFAWFEGRPNVSGTEAGTAAKWHRNEGIYLHVAPGSSQRSTGPPVQVNQICATLLALAGMPPAQGIAPSIASSEGQPVDYRRGFVRPRPAKDTRGASEQVAQLKALGYLGGGDTTPHGNSTRTAGSFNNEGLILQQDGRADAAAMAFVSALEVDPQSASAKFNLGELLRSKGADAAIELLSRIQAAKPSPEVLMQRGRYRLEKHDCRGALDDFRASGLHDAIAFASIGTAEACVGNRAAAVEALKRSLALDPNQPPVREFLHDLH